MQLQRRLHVPMSQTHLQQQHAMARDNEEARSPQSIVESPSRLAKMLRGARDLFGELVLPRSTLTLGNIVSAVVLSGIFLLISPMLMPELKRSLVGADNADERNGLHGRLESIMSWVERSVEDLPAFPRLHPQECVKRSVCEAHYQPKKYGLPGLLLQLIFPPHIENEGNEPSRVVNKYQIAA
ncbi:hypothetical protein GZH46_00433, partial [Fragariocoptes setiger]